MYLGGGGFKFLELNFANIQSFGPSKRSPEQQISGLFYVPKKVMLIFLILGPFPGIAKIGVLTRHLLEDLTGIFFYLQEP